MECLVCHYANKNIKYIEIAPKMTEDWSSDQYVSENEFHKGAIDTVT